MKRLFTTLALCFLLMPVYAQVTVKVDDTPSTVQFKDGVKTDTENAPTITTEAQRKAERAAIRKERNTIEVNASLNGSLSNFNSKWRNVNGTTNSITGITSFLVKHSFTKDKFTIDNKFTGKIGVTNQSSEWKKSQDEWFISTAPAYKMTEHWNFGAILSLRSQFANGFNDSKQITSSAFAPAYLDFSLGFTYVCPNTKFPIKINLSPISMSATYVTNNIVRSHFFNSKNFTDIDGNPVTFEDWQNGAILDAESNTTGYCYGLTPENGKSRYEGGSSIQIDFDKTFGSKGIFRYRTTLNSFFGWINEIAQQTGKYKELYEHIAPTVRWEHTVDIKATKYFSTQFYFQMYYNKAQVHALQTQIILGVGLSYTFKNK